MLLMSNHPIKIFTAVTAVAAMFFAAAGCEKKDKHIRVDQPLVEVDADIHSVTVRVEASSSWFSYTAEEWLRAYNDENDPMVLHIDITEKNNSLRSRAGEIAIVTGDAQKAIITVRQLALDAYITVTPSELAEFGGRGGTQTLAVTTSNLEGWLFVNQSDWLTVTRDEGTDILTVRAAYSNNLEPRKDTIIVYTDLDGFEALNDTIPVVQAGLDLALQSEGMEDNTVSINHEAGIVEYRVISKYSWTVTIDNGGTPSDASGEESDQWWNISFTVPENATAADVTYTITFTCDGEEYTYTIIQSAADGGGEPEP